MYIKNNKLNESASIIFLQQLIRGRAVQNQMYENKEERIDLINELRSTHALLEDERAEKERQKLTNLSNQEHYAREIDQVS